MTDEVRRERSAAVSRLATQRQELILGQVRADGAVGDTRFAIGAMAANSLPVILPSPRRSP